MPREPVMTMRWLAILMLVWLAGCKRDRGVVIEKIPGTELTALEAYSLTISPDERWLTFLEWMMPRSRFREEAPTQMVQYHLVSLNLSTRQRTQHTVESIPEGSVWTPEHRAPWSYNVWWVVVDRFRPSGWNGGVFYLDPRARTRDLALDPRKPEIYFATRPEALTCSDCPPHDAWQRTKYAHHLWNLYEPASNVVSGVFRDGAIRTIYHVGMGTDQKLMVFRLREDGDEKLILEKQGKKGTLSVIARVRVSPDERYLAYDLHSKKQEFLTGPRERVFILDLDTHKEKKVATHGYVSNLMWSPDGNRLYFAAGEYEDYAGIYCVNVPATFSR